MGSVGLLVRVSVNDQNAETESRTGVSVRIELAAIPRGKPDLGTTDAVDRNIHGRNVRPEKDMNEDRSDASSIDLERLVNAE